MTQPPEILKIKKYPNRRFYDATRSRHVTLDELHRLVRAGHQIEVIDAEGRDITNVVLTQILLEHDPPKLDLFPASLLHQAVQANQAMVRRFIDEYFSKAMDLFLNSRKQFDAFLSQAGLSPLQPATPFDWARKFLMGFGTAEGGRGRGGERETGVPPSVEPSSIAKDPAIESLRAEVAALRTELGRAQLRRGTGGQKRRAVESPRKSGKRRKPRRRGD